MTSLYKKSVIFLIAILIMQPGLFKPLRVSAGTGVVRAVLFYSSTCPHCHEVINEVLPPLMKQYSSQLGLAGFDVGTKLGQDLYKAAVQRFAIPEERIGVPTLIIGEIVLVGSLEIPEQLPGIIEAGLKNGGNSWPDIPGMDAALPHQTSFSKLSPIELFKQDVWGNGLALVVLVGMTVTLIGLPYRLQRKKVLPELPEWTIPALTGLGLLVAGYLSYVEITQVQAICGPVGNCNAVQQSPYARLFGVIPVGILGILGYLAILALWSMRHLGNPAWQKKIAMAITLAAALGIIFSIYLTFLEPFVIGASCMWCLSSALLITLIFVVSAGGTISVGTTKLKRRR